MPPYSRFRDLGADSPEGPGLIRVPVDARQRTPGCGGPCAASAIARYSDAIAVLKPGRNYPGMQSCVCVGRYEDGSGYAAKMSALASAR